jgi:hypothetical protein
MSNASSYTIPTWPTNSVTDITYHSTHSIFSIHIPIIHSHDPQCLANICTNSPYALCALSFPYRITNHTDCVTDNVANDTITGTNISLAIQCSLVLTNSALRHPDILAHCANTSTVIIRTFDSALRLLNDTDHSTVRVSNHAIDCTNIVFALCVSHHATYHTNHSTDTVAICINIGSNHIVSIAVPFKRTHRTHQLRRSQQHLGRFKL